MGTAKDYAFKQANSAKGPNKLWEALEEEWRVQILIASTRRRNQEADIDAQDGKHTLLMVRI